MISGHILNLMCWINWLSFLVVFPSMLAIFFVCILAKKKIVIDYVEGLALLPLQKLMQHFLSWKCCLAQVAQTFLEFYPKESAVLL